MGLFEAFSDCDLTKCLARILVQSCTLVIGWILVTVLLFGVGAALRYRNIKHGKRIKADPRKVILVTGATSGIGLELAKHFYKIGFSVIAGYYSDQESGYGELLELVTARPKSTRESGKGTDVARPQLFLVPMNVRSQESIEESSKAVDLLLERHNLRLFALINNAGVSSEGMFGCTSRRCIKSLVETNYLGTLLVTREFLLKIVKNKGRIVNVSTGIFRLPYPGVSVYGSGKSAIVYFSTALHNELKSYGASCVTVAPGNFTLASNIILTRLRSVQASERELSEDEKSFYRDSLDGYRNMIESMVREKLNLTNQEESETFAKTHGIELRSDSGLSSSGRGAGSRSGWMARMLETVYQMIDGGPGDKSLQESGIVYAYEDAVCLQDPPKRIYAGGWFYEVIIAAVMEFVPPIVLDYITLFGADVIESRFK